MQPRTSPSQCRINGQHPIGERRYIPPGSRGGSNSISAASGIASAGKKTFLAVRRSQGRLTVGVWVGAELRASLGDDPRFHIPRHIGHHGWIDLDIEYRFDFDEVRRLALGSYRHFALKRCCGRWMA